MFRNPNEKLQILWDCHFTFDHLVLVDVWFSFVLRMIYASPIVDPCSSPVYSCPWRPRLVPVAVEQTNSRNPPFHNGRSSTGQCKRLPYIFPQRGAAWIFPWVHIVSPGLVHNCAAQDNQIRRRARSVPLTCHASTSLDSAQLVLQSTKTKVTHGIHLFEITNRFFSEMRVTEDV